MKSDAIIYVAKIVGIIAIIFFIQSYEMKKLELDNNEVKNTSVIKQIEREHNKFVLDSIKLTRD